MGGLLDPGLRRKPLIPANCPAPASAARVIAQVAQLSGYVSEHSAYHHGEASLQQTIIGLAQVNSGVEVVSPGGASPGRPVTTLCFDSLCGFLSPQPELWCHHSLN